MEIYYTHMHHLSNQPSHTASPTAPHTRKKAKQITIARAYKCKYAAPHIPQTILISKRQLLTIPSTQQPQTDSKQINTHIHGNNIFEKVRGITEHNTNAETTKLFTIKYTFRPNESCGIFTPDTKSSPSPSQLTHQISTTNNTLETNSNNTSGFKRLPAESPPMCDPLFSHGAIPKRS